MKVNSLRNKVVLVTGGDSELSRQLAFDMAMEKAQVILVGKNKDLIEQVSQKIEAQKKKVGSVTALAVDWRTIAEMERGFAAIKKIEGSIDIAVINQNDSTITKFDELTTQIVEKKIDIDLKLQCLFLNLVLNELRNTKKPIMVRITDHLNEVGTPYFSIANMINFAFKGFFESITRELSNERIKFLNVKTPIGKEKFSEETSEKLEKIGYTNLSVEKASAAIIHAINADKSSLDLQAKEKSLVFSNVFSKKTVDKKFKTIRTKLLNALSATE